MIIFYDIPSKLPVPWSPNTWKTRYVLNYKNIPYKTEWVEYPDIENHLISLNITTSEKKANGAPHYTLPAIWDQDTGVKLGDSFEILKYLEKQYPQKPTLFPHNSQGLQTAFEVAYKQQLNALWEFILPALPQQLNTPSALYFYRTRSEQFGMPLEKVVPTGEERVKKWAAYKAGLGVVDGWYQATDNVGPWLMGDKISSGDVLVVSFAVFLKIIWGEESTEWKDISSWHEGRWAKLVSLFNEYAEVK